MTDIPPKCLSNGVHYRRSIHKAALTVYFYARIGQERTRLCRM
nr:MAG TPA: hypothetical protein [Caudoviricetes sp.]